MRGVAGRGDRREKAFAFVVERFRGVEPAEIPARLVAHHGPFTWGNDPLDAVKNTIAPERVAELALLTLRLQPGPSIPAHLVEQHFGRKHGPGTTYGNG
jgi:L-ribulose-5-phosphate 4-epimerase